MAAFSPGAQCTHEGDHAECSDEETSRRPKRSLSAQATAVGTFAAVFTHPPYFAYFVQPFSGLCVDFFKTMNAFRSKNDMNMTIACCI